jgi:hypothetical protein
LLYLLHRLSKDEKAKNLAFFEQKKNKIGKKIFSATAKKDQ